MPILNEISPKSRLFSIAMSPVFLSMIPFILLTNIFGFYYFYLIFPILGLIIGIYWMIRVKNNKTSDDYKISKIMNTPEMIETWEKSYKHPTKPNVHSTHSAAHSTHSATPRSSTEGKSVQITRQRFYNGIQ